jgi:hypothetical protein
MAEKPRSADDPKSGSDYTQDGDHQEVSLAAVAHLQWTVEALKCDVSLLRDQIAIQTSIENGFGALGEAIRNLAPKQNFEQLEREARNTLNAILDLHPRIDFTVADFGSKWPEIIKKSDEGAKSRSLGA